MATYLFEEGHVNQKAIGTLGRRSRIRAGGSEVIVRAPVWSLPPAHEFQRWHTRSRFAKGCSIDLKVTAAAYPKDGREVSGCFIRRVHDGIVMQLGDDLIGRLPLRLRDVMQYPPQNSFSSRIVVATP